MNKVENILDVDGLHIRSEILRAVVLQFAHKFYRGILLLHVYAQKRIRLVVFEKDVVSRRVFFDEIVFGKERVHFACAR